MPAGINRLRGSGPTARQYWSPWSESKTFISVSLGLHARRLFFFAANGTSFPRDEFIQRLQPWLRLEAEEYEPDEMPLVPCGMVHPTSVCQHMLNMMGMLLRSPCRHP